MSRERELSERIHREIPVAAAMGIAVERLGVGGVELGAPLAPNVNDKGCAFGGSLVSLLTLAGWALVREVVGTGEEAEIYVADSRIEYLCPVRETLRAFARLPPEVDPGAAERRFRERGRVRLPVVAELRLADGQVACRLEAGFAALRSVHSHASR
jgi:thioesterase domain-containing protein